MKLDLKKQILNLAREKKKIQTSDVVNKTGVSRQYASRIIRVMLDKGILVKSGDYRYSWYALPENILLLGERIEKRFLNTGLSEDKILKEIVSQAPYLYQKDNVGSIFDYAFSEMLNNAIEHSKSKYIEIEVNTTDDHIIFRVKDHGIGVFKNIMQKKKLNSELEAIRDLLKGKMTTAPKAHSGEGIFFTSKVADIFTLESFGYRLRIDNTIDDIFIEEQKPSRRGTAVIFELSKKSKLHLSNIFEKYQTNPEEYAFDKTEIKVRLYTMGTIYISRSQARRVLSGLEKFKMVILDFDKVPTVGQAFADEVFRVFKLNNPQIEIVPVNMNEAVEFMVGRVEKI